MASQQIDQETKDKIQQEYQSITAFSPGWARKLAEKYSVTEQDVLEIISL
jgi:hypothetical protein